MNEDPNLTSSLIELSTRAFKAIGRTISRRGYYQLARGNRIQIVAFLACQSSGAVLLVKSALTKKTCWMCPQEGVNPSESFKHALGRLFSEELGFNLDDAMESRTVYLRSIQYFGTLKLPKERIGERPITDDAAGSIHGLRTLRAKSYWAARMLVNDFRSVSFSPKTEIDQAQWYNFEQAKEMIRNTNRTEKAELLVSELTSFVRNVGLD